MNAELLDGEKAITKSIEHTIDQPKSEEASRRSKT